MVRIEVSSVIYRLKKKNAIYTVFIKFLAIVFLTRDCPALNRTSVIRVEAYTLSNYLRVLFYRIFFLSFNKYFVFIRRICNE